MADAVSAFLGLTPEAIAAERAAGQSQADIAEDQGKDTAGLVQTILSAKQGQIQQAVADGQLTQERADAMLDTMTERVTERVVDPAMGPRGGNGMGFGGGVYQTDAS